MTDKDQKKLDEAVAGIEKKKKPVEMNLQKLDEQINALYKQREAKQQQINAQREKAEQEAMYKEANDRVANLNKEIKSAQQSIDFLEGAVTRAIEAGKTNTADKQAAKLPGEYERLTNLKNDLEDAIAFLAGINDMRKRAEERLARNLAIDEAQKNMMQMHQQYEEGLQKYQDLNAQYMEMTQDCSERDQKKE